jgi:hypothetical protein
MTTAHFGTTAPEASYTVPSTDAKVDCAMVGVDQSNMQAIVPPRKRNPKSLKRLANSERLVISVIPLGELKPLAFKALVHDWKIPLNLGTKHNAILARECYDGVTVSAHDLQTRPMITEFKPSRTLSQEEC